MNSESKLNKLKLLNLIILHVHLHIHQNFSVLTNLTEVNVPVDVRAQMHNLSIFIIYAKKLWWGDLTQETF